MHKRLLAIVEAIGVGIATIGVGMWSIPAALICFGVVLVAACEVRA